MIIRRQWIGSGDRRRILLVEGSDALALALTRGLLTTFDVVGSVSSAGDAVERLARLDDPRNVPEGCPVDVVVIGDVLDGELFGRRLIEIVNKLWPKVSCVYHTDETLSLVRGADAIVRRPIAIDVLRSVIERVAPRTAGSA